MLSIEWDTRPDRPGPPGRRLPLGPAPAAAPAGRRRHREDRRPVSRRRPPLTPLRVISAYVITVVAIATGAPFVYLGLVEADRLDGPGGLGWGSAGYLVAALVAVAVLAVLSTTTRAGPWFFLLDLTMVLVPNLISPGWWTSLAALVLAPGVAAWVAHPPLRRDRAGRTRRRLVLTRAGVVVGVAAGMPLVLRLAL